MILSDIALEYIHPWPYPQLTRWTVYLTLAATTCLGMVAKRPKSPLWVLPLLSLGASGLFFVTSNLATWAEGQLYPLTIQGLNLCYIEAIPFLKNTVIADLVGTALLFSVGPVLERVGARAARALSSRPSVELAPVDRNHVA